MKKKLVLIVSVVTAALLFTASAMAAPNRNPADSEAPIQYADGDLPWANAPALPSSPQVTFNGEQIQFDAAPFITNGKLMIPVRQLSEAARARVEWDATSRTALVHKNLMHMEFAVGKSEFLIRRDADFTGIPQVVKLIVPSRIVNGRVFVQATALTDSFDLMIDWEAATKTLVVKTKPQPMGSVIEMNLGAIKSMELFTLDQQKERDCTDSEKSLVMDSFNTAIPDPDTMHVQIITGKTLTVSFYDGTEINFTSYGSETHVVAVIRKGTDSQSYHLIAPDIAKFLLQ